MQEYPSCWLQLIEVGGLVISLIKVDGFLGQPMKELFFSYSFESDG